MIVNLSQSDIEYIVNALSILRSECYPVYEDDDDLLRLQLYMDKKLEEMKEGNYY